MKQLTEAEALHRCAAYCSTAERCIQDIRNRLDRWQIPVTEQQNILARLQKEQFLNEARYCRAFINDKALFAKWGRQKIAYSLKGKNIPEATINQALSEHLPQDNDELLTQLLLKKKSTIKGASDYEVRIKLTRFAAGRGFGFDAIERCLNKLFKR